MKITIAVFLSVLSAVSIFAQRQTEVRVTSTYLRKLPDSTSEKVQTVQKGDKLTLEKKQEANGWYYVSVSNGKIKGWVRKDTVGSIVKAPAVRTPSDIERPRKVAAVSTNTVAAPTAGEASATANSEPEDEEVIRVETEEVSLNIRVVDDNNRSVSNLNQSNFKVYEDDVLQPIISLTTTEVPVINAFVIDNSRSLRSQLKSITEAGKIIVVKNRSADESAVVRFVGAEKIEVLQDFTANKSSVVEGLDKLFVEGGQTAIVDAVYFAAKKIERYQNSKRAEDNDRLRALILVSDGDDRASSYKEEQLFELLRKSRVQIYAVGFVNNLSGEPDAAGVNRQEKAKAFLTCLTQETGGKVYFPASIDELSQIAADISVELHTQYLISYTPTNERRDGTFRKIKVVIDEGASREKRIASTRAGRIAAAK